MSLNFLASLQIGDEKKDVNLKMLSENKGAKTQSSETVLEDGLLIPETPHHFSDKSMVECRTFLCLQKIH